MTSEIFVFGSNRKGLHGGGAARVAHEQHGAEWGVGEGRTGNSYALPTKADFARTLTLEELREHVECFLVHARANSADTFMLTQVGCGLAGLTKEQVAPLFRAVPANVNAPLAWHEIIFGEIIPARISFTF